MMKKSSKIFLNALLASVLAFSSACASSANLYAVGTPNDSPANVAAPTATTVGTETENTLADTWESEASGEVDEVVATQSTAVEEAPTSIDLAGGSVAARSLLKTKGLAGSDELTFSSVRLSTTKQLTEPTTQYGTNYEWPTVYLGVKEGEDYLDISKATAFDLFLNDISGFVKVKWRAVDENGVVQRIVNYSAQKGTCVSLDGTETKFSTSTSNYLGSVVSTSDEGIFLHSAYPTDATVTEAVVNADKVEFAGEDTTFDETKVVAFMVSISANSTTTKTLDIGSLSATIDGKKVVLWDADEATEKSYANVFTDANNKSFSTFNLDKNEWYLGATPAGITNDPTGWGATDIGITATYTKKSDSLLEYTVSESATADVWTSLYEDDGLNIIANEKILNLSACNAMVFDADFSEANGVSAIDFAIRTTADGSTENETYKSFGRAMLIDEKNTVTTCTANSFPAGFKGKVIIPFTSFKTTLAAETTFMDATYRNSVLKVNAIIAMKDREKMNEVGDTVKIDNIQLVQKSAQELNVLHAVAEFRLDFKMQAEAHIKLSEPNGLYFGVDANNTKYDAVNTALNGLTYEFGMIIVPDTDAYKAAMPYDTSMTVLTIKKNLSGETVGSTYSWYAAIVKIKESNYDRDFTARAYLRYSLGEETYVVWAQGDVTATSVYTLAKAAQGAGTTDNAYINGIVEYVENQ